MSDLIETTSKAAKSDFFKTSNLTPLRGYIQMRTSGDESNVSDIPLVRLSHSRHMGIKAYLSDLNFEDNTPSSDSEDDVTSVPKESKTINYEDSESLINNVFNARDFIVNETWETNEMIKSRVVNYDEEFVYLDCIVDLDMMLFEHRQFPRNMFSNFKTLNAGDLVMIKIKSNPGSLRIDIYSGRGIISPDLFNINDDIEKLKEQDKVVNLRGEW